MEGEQIKPARRIFRLFANKYTFVGLFFILWMVFFDRHSHLQKMELQAKIDRLEEAKKQYELQIEEDRRKIEELESNKENLEKFAREQFLMKLPNEEIYVVVKE